MKSKYLCHLIFLLLILSCTKNYLPTGNVIFIHPDGTGLGHWNAARTYLVGPDNDLNFDKLSNLAAYRSHQTDILTTSSHAGATTHAYGIKVKYDSFGMDGTTPIKSLSNKSYSVMIEAKNAGINVGIINSGHLAEPGTAVFLTTVTDRKLTDLITEQLIKQNAKVIFGGGEELFLPPSKVGFHGQPGIRQDGKDIIELATNLGYKVIYTKNQLLELPANTPKVLGIFSAKDTFHDKTEEELKKENLPCYASFSPTVAEMTQKALEILSFKNKQFFLVTEEEGTDNFSNKNNAICMLEAMKRADDTIGVALDFLKRDPRTLILLAADSDAGHPTTYASTTLMSQTELLPATTLNGAPLDGVEGTQTMPFISKPDHFGTVHPFGIAWASTYDNLGSVISKAHGFNAKYLPVNIQNKDIYKIFFKTLFGINLP